MNKPYQCKQNNRYWINIWNGYVLSEKHFQNKMKRLPADYFKDHLVAVTLDFPVSFKPHKIVNDAYIIIKSAVDNRSKRVVFTKKQRNVRLKLLMQNKFNQSKS